MKFQYKVSPVSHHGRTGKVTVASRYSALVKNGGRFAAVLSSLVIEILIPVLTDINHDHTDC